MFAAPLTVLSIRCPSVVYVNCPFLHETGKSYRNKNKIQFRRPSAVIGFLFDAKVASDV
jgi:hypothetical protein